MARSGSNLERRCSLPWARTTFYERADDSTYILIEFANGATGVVHVTAVAYEPTPFGQTRHLEFHGSAGTLHSYTDWDKINRWETVTY